MLKDARKHSEDPAQESLREIKDSWNKETSLLIAELIAFKQGINGRGSKFLNIPPSSIKDPLPSEISHYIGYLSNHAQDVMSGAQRIREYQEQYSVNRKKSASFEKNSSWWGSRFLARITLLNKVSKVERKLRLRLLNSSQELKLDCEKLETLILDKNVENLPQAVIKLTEMLFYVMDDFGLTFKNFQKLIIEAENVKLLAEKEQKQPIPFKEIFDQRLSLNIIVNHLKQLPTTSSEDKVKLEKLFIDFNHKSNKYEALLQKETSTEILEPAYQEVLILFQNLKEIIQKYLGPTDSFKEMADKLAKLDYDSLIKESNNISNFFNKKLLSIAPDSFDRIKLDTLDLLSDLKSELNNFMNLLESKNIDNKIFLIFHIIIQLLIDISDKIENLGEIVTLQFRKTKNKKFKSLDLRDFRKLKELRNKVNQLILE